MIGTVYRKGEGDSEKWAEMTRWCNSTQQGIIEDKGDYYEVVSNPNYKTEEESRLIQLRAKRSRECFPVINRGALWYDRLNDNQKAELSNWYQAWLDVTETLEVPDRPEWLE